MKIKMKLDSEYYERALSAERHRQMLMHQYPRLAALLPNTCVADRHVDVFPVFHLRREVHRHGRPRDVAVPCYLQLLTRRQRSGRGVVKQVLMNSRLIFFPALIGERGEIVEDQSIVLGVELAGVRGVAGTPRGAVVINQLSKRRFVAGLLLSPRSGKRQQSSKQGKQNVNGPVETRASLATVRQRIPGHEHLAT